MKDEQEVISNERMEQEAKSEGFACHEPKKRCAIAAVRRPGQGADKRKPL